MRALAIALLLLPGAAWAGPTQALADFQQRFRSAAFSESRLSAKDQLVLAASDEYLNAMPSQREAYVGEALVLWGESLRAAGSPQEPAYAVVNWPAGGSLWKLSGGKAERLEEWADDRLPFGGKTRGRLFGFVGGQTVSGDVDATSFQARLGSRLFQDRYDAALSYGYTTIHTNKTKSRAYGVVGRALFPLSAQVGWNVGALLSRTSAPGGGDDSLGLLAGLNFHLPGGSFDVSLQATDGGTYGLLAGYTLFFNRP